MRIDLQSSSRCSTGRLWSIACRGVPGLHGHRHLDTGHPGHRPKDASEVLEMVLKTIKLFPVGTPGLVYCITRPGMALAREDSRIWKEHRAIALFILGGPYGGSFSIRGWDYNRPEIIVFSRGLVMFRYWVRLLVGGRVLHREHSWALWDGRSRVRPMVKMNYQHLSSRHLETQLNSP